MTVLSDICTLGPYVLDISVLKPTILANGDFIILFFDNDVSTVKFPKFQYLFSLACKSPGCPDPLEFSGNEDVDLIISIEFQQRIRRQWRTYALTSFNYTQQRLLSYYPMSDNENCPNLPPFISLELWKEFILKLSLEQPTNEKLTEFASYLIDGKCKEKGFKSFNLNLTLPPSVPYYSEMFITDEIDGKWWNGAPFSGRYETRNRQLVGGGFVSLFYAISLGNDFSGRFYPGRHVYALTVGGFYTGNYYPPFWFDSDQVDPINERVWTPIEVHHHAITIGSMDEASQLSRMSTQDARRYIQSFPRVPSGWNMMARASGDTLAEIIANEQELAYPNYWTRADLGRFRTVSPDPRVRPYRPGSPTTARAPIGFIPEDDPIVQSPRPIPWPDSPVEKEVIKWPAAPKRIIVPKVMYYPLPDEDACTVKIRNIANMIDKLLQDRIEESSVTSTWWVTEGQNAEPPKRPYDNPKIMEINKQLAYLPLIVARINLHISLDLGCYWSDIFS